MNIVVLLAVAAVGLVLRQWLRHMRRPAAESHAHSASAPFTGDVWLVAAREIRERVRGRIFRLGTLLILAAVAAAIVIPTLMAATPQVQRVGVVGALPAAWRAAVASSAQSIGTSARFVPEPGKQAADGGLRSGNLDLVIIDGQYLVVNKPVQPTDNSTTAQFVHAVAKSLGVAEAVAAAHLSAAQSAALASAKALPVQSIQPGAVTGATRTTSLVGLIVIFVMLTQYNTWILTGVMEEKSSRVIEVLLAAVRPRRLLTGKVAGIGLVAFAQASLIVVFALVLAKAVGSGLLQGTAPLVLVSTLVWLVLGYAFYCWVYAAAGSLAERQSQVQTLAFPLSIPIVVGYVISVTAATTGTASAFFKVLAYLPPTAPFAMPVLVGLRSATWWEFLASAIISLVCTAEMARLATSIYRRAILQTGGRVKVRQMLVRAS
jgi:ABC-2 type transport system permease protein